MHEASIAERVVEIVHENVPAPRLPAVGSVRVTLGPLSGVVGESLQFCFEALVGDTGLSGARLDIELVPCVGQCRECGSRLETEDPLLVCLTCGGTSFDIESGDELVVSQIHLQESAAPPVEGADEARSDRCVSTAGKTGGGVR